MKILLNAKSFTVKFCNSKKLCMYVLYRNFLYSNTYSYSHLFSLLIMKLFCITSIAKISMMLTVSYGVISIWWLGVCCQNILMGISTCKYVYSAQQRSNAWGCYRKGGITLLAPFVNRAKVWCCCSHSHFCAQCTFF